MARAAGRGRPTSTACPTVLLRGDVVVQRVDTLTGHVVGLAVSVTCLMLRLTGHVAWWSGV
eukprot:6426247-Prymnesium_polylepis.2